MASYSECSLYFQVKTFNGGNVCGPRGGPCDVMELCPYDPQVQVKVMSVNLGGHCSDGGNKNIDSIVMKVRNIHQVSQWLVIAKRLHSMGRSIYTLPVVITSRRLVIIESNGSYEWYLRLVTGRENSATRSCS